ncbi:hydroxysteroid dehydrogenase-like protein 1 [Glossina fuscipes fuscipes]
MSAFCEMLSSAISLIGVLAIICFLYDNFKSLFSILKAVLQPYFRPQLPHNLADKFGKWAVITGGSDGIGKGYAKELAKRGLNVVIISRTKEKLIATANEIENLYKTEVKWIVADFSKGKEVYEHIKQELLGIPIGILVNNVGCASYPDKLCNRSEDWLWNIINLNVGAVTLMSRIVIPQMKKQGKGAIVNIASSAHWIPTPLAAVYGATKRYVRSLSLAMERELFKYNINVQCVEPWFVRTELIQFSDILSRNKYFGTPVDTFTRSAVFILGKTLETTGYWTHAIMTFFAKLFPEWLAIRGFHFISNYVRKDYLRNQLEGKEN